MRRVLTLNVEVLERSRVQKLLTRREVANLAGISLTSAKRAFSSGAVGLRVAKAIAQVLEIDPRTMWEEGGMKWEPQTRQGSGGAAFADRARREQRER
jgi:hypothetical protein